MLPALLLVLVVGPPAVADTTPGPAILFQLVAQRMALMEDVAHYKFRHQVAVEDLEREQVVLDKALQAAAEAGLDPASVDAYFRMQFQVAKAVQYRALADYMTRPPGAPAPDLVAEIRPRLIEIGDAILAALSTHISRHGPLTSQSLAAFEQAMDLPRVTAGEKRLLHDALTGIRLR